MELPPFAPFPPANLRKDIVPEEWELCLDAWLLLAEGHLLLSPESFASKLSKDQSLPRFLFSYVEAMAGDVNHDELDPRSKQLRRKCYLLIHRCLSEPKQKPPLLLDWQFLSDVCIIYSKSPSLKPLLHGLWQAEHLDDRFKKNKASLTRSLEAAATNDDLSGLGATLARTAALLRVCPAYGHLLLLGSDFIDAVTTLHTHASPPFQRKLVVITYRCLLALMDPSFPRFSTLLDHLYSMHSSASLLADLCSSTPFIQKLRERIAGPEAIRAEKLIQKLSALEGTAGPLASRGKKKPLRNKPDKGKGKQNYQYGHGAFDGGMHVHRMSLVTQIQDLFPDLGSGFIIKLLDEYGDDTEEVTAHLLDHSLSAHLKSLNRSESLPQPSSPRPATDLARHLPPRATPPLLPTRRNIHDNDAFDRLTIDPSQIHRGLKSSSRTADSVLQDRSSALNKAAILSALAAFDSDDDERDDTYDVGDVGGTVDTALPGGDEVDADLRDKNEEALFRAWKMSSEVFERDAATKRGKARMALKSETGMTDEAIEGWGIMVGRDPRRLRRLEA
ncbi:MAG: hypothetical protein Q9207_004620, partial [Kuettlingeria erythrocarpa]